MEEVLARLLLGLGLGSLVAITTILICGAAVEKIPWADRAIFTCLAMVFAAVVGLLLLGSATDSRSVVYTGFGLVLGMGVWALAVGLPLGLIVARVRKRKGWLLSIAGKPPVGRESQGPVVPN